jgi:hypothetical protein
MLELVDHEVRGLSCHKTCSQSLTFVSLYALEHESKKATLVHLLLCVY